MYKLWIVIVLCLCTLVQSGWWLSWGESRYYFGTRLSTWSESQDICRNDRKAHLAVITSAEENNYLKQQINDRHYWIGLRQGLDCTCASVDPETCRTCRDSWTWHDGTPMGFQQWVDNEPGNSDCARLTPGGWAEYHCQSGDFRYICERPLCQTWRCDNGDCRAANGTAYCICAPEYTGQHCDVDVDECEQNNPCQNDGTCDNKDGGYACMCAPGWDGDQCKSNINECLTSQCKNNGQCRDTIGSFHCDCMPGYGGDRCENDINECVSSPCRNNGVCKDRLNRFECNCTEQYHGVSCQLEIGKSEDIGESGLLKNVKEEDLVISISVAAVLAAVSMVVFVILLVLELRYRSQTPKTENNEMTLATRNEAAEDIDHDEKL